MSESVVNLKTERGSTPYLRENPLFEQVTGVTGALEAQIFDSITEAAQQAAPLVDALNDVASETNLLGRAITLRSNTLSIPDVTLDPQTGAYTCRSKLAPVNELDGVATRTGPFEGFMYMVVPITQDGENMNGYVARLCYQLDMQRKVSLPYVKGNLCAFAPIAGSELTFLADTEREVAAASRLKLQKLLRVSGIRAFNHISQLDESLRGEHPFSPETLQAVGQHAHDVLSRLGEVAGVESVALAKEAIADLVKARLWLTRNMSIGAAQVVHQYPSWLLEPHIYKFMGGQTISGTPLDIGFTHQYVEVPEENRTYHENDKEYALSFVFSQIEKDGTPVTVYVPFDKIRQLKHI